MLKIDVYTDKEGNLYIEDPELHWINKFSCDGRIIGFIDPVTREFVEATDPEEIRYWNEWFQEAQK